MKVIFCDVDGVLVSEEGFREAQLSGKQNVMFDKTALRWLKWLVEQTGGRVVITSSWRPYSKQRPTMSYLWLRSILVHNGTPVIGETPRLTQDGVSDRSDEIFAWMRERQVESFVVLDDNDRFFHHPEIQKRWVKIDSACGLREEAAKQAAFLLDRTADLDGTQ